MCKYRDRPDGSYECYELSEEEKKSAHLSFASSINGISVTKIGDEILRGNKHISQIIIPNSIKVIGRNTFRDSVVEEFNHMPGEQNMYLVDEYAFYNSRIKKLSLPDTVGYIGTNAFANCGILSKIVLPADLSWIGSHAFYNCAFREGIVKLLKLNENLENVRNCAFGELNIKTLSIPKNKIHFDYVNAFKYSVINEVCIYDDEGDVEHYIIPDIDVLYQILKANYY